MKVLVNEIWARLGPLPLPQELSTGATWFISTLHQERPRPQWINIFVSRPSWSKMSGAVILNGAPIH
jgi:hypothetical protein